MKKPLVLGFVVITILSSHLSVFCTDFVEDMPFDENNGATAQRAKTAEELKLERIIEQTYELYMLEVIINGQELLVRIPFGMQGERFPEQRFILGGKGTPKELWPIIMQELNSDEFAEYIEMLLSPGEKLVFFDLPTRSIRFITDSVEMGKVELGDRMYPVEIKRTPGFNEIDVYNYLYTKGIGVDCSGFVFNILRSIGFSYGIDLVDSFSTDPINIGSWIFNDWNVQVIEDKIINLRPGDVIQFHSWTQPYNHSAVIRSIDLEKGEIVYYQTSDWIADPRERGPHASRILFDPLYPERRITDLRVIWDKRFGEAFVGEPYIYAESGDWYRYTVIRGGGRVVRLNVLSNLILQAEPDF